VPGPTHTPITEERPPARVPATGGTDGR
jgi:hypothetical protein